MPDNRIVDLTEDTTPDASDVIYASDAAGSVDKRVPLSALPVSTLQAAADAAAQAAAEATAEAYTDAEIAALSGTYLALAGGYVAGNYYTTPAGSSQLRSYSANELRVVPYLVRSQTTFDRIAVELTTAGTTSTVFRLGIWNHNPATGQPGTLLLDAGTVAGTGATGAREATISQVLQPGWVWLGAAGQVLTGSPVLRGVSGGIPGSPVDVTAATGTSVGLINGLVYTGVSGAFASLASTSPASLSGLSPAILLRAA